MKVDIVEELEKKRRTTRSNAGKAMEEVGLLMDPNNQREVDALRKSGLNVHLKDIEHAKGQEMTRIKYEEKYGGKVFTGAELRELCLKYDLRLLRSERFCGKVDGEVGKKLADFIETHNSEIGGYTDSFHILAPGSAFNLDNRPAKLRWVDPVLVYNIPKTEDYVFIHKWGADFTVWRRLRGLFFQSVGNMFTMTMSFYMILTSAIFALINDSFVGGFWQHLHLLWIGAIGAVCTLFTLAIMFKDFEDWDERTTHYTWDSNKKRRQ